MFARVLIFSKMVLHFPIMSC